MDIIDVAQREIERAYERAEAARVGAAPVGESAVECAECDLPIPEARRVIVPGVQTCVDCQELIERGVL